VNRFSQKPSVFRLAEFVSNTLLFTREIEVDNRLLAAPGLKERRGRGCVWKNIVLAFQAYGKVYSEIVSGDVPKATAASHIREGSA